MGLDHIPRDERAKEYGRHRQSREKAGLQMCHFSVLPLWGVIKAFGDCPLELTILTEGEMNDD
jgi:hypothetical protein